MTTLPKPSLLLTLLVLGTTLAMAAPAHAQGRSSQGPEGMSATIQINFGNAPHWMDVPGTRVLLIREDERPDYDMFKCRGSYYVYNSSGWYVSRRWRGQFRAIDDREVPRDLYSVPRGHWRNYPNGWMDRDHSSRSDDRGKGRSGERKSERSDKGKHK